MLTAFRQRLGHFFLHGEDQDVTVLVLFQLWETSTQTICARSRGAVAGMLSDSEARPD